MTVAVAVWLLLYFWLVGHRARKQFNQISFLKREQKLSWNAQKLFFQSDNGNTHFDIDEFHQCAADSQILLLYPAEHLFYFLPRRIFKSDAQFDALVTQIRQSETKWL